MGNNYGVMAINSIGQQCWAKKRGKMLTFATMREAEAQARDLNEATEAFEDIVYSGERID